MFWLSIFWNLGGFWKKNINVFRTLFTEIHLSSPRGQQNTLHNLVSHGNSFKQLLTNKRCSSSSDIEFIFFHTLTTSGSILWEEAKSGISCQNLRHLNNERGETQPEYLTVVFIQKNLVIIIWVANESTLVRTKLNRFDSEVQHCASRSTLALARLACQITGYFPAQALKAYF